MSDARADARGPERTILSHDGTPLGSSAEWRDPLVGTILDGRYRVVLRVGQGGFAVVYHARHERLGTDVAVKVLRSELAHDRRVLARFVREARTTSLIDHDNVVRVMDFGCADGGAHYLVTEYVTGTPLSVPIAATGPLAPLRVAHITAQVAAGVGRAHTLGVVHRDLKPENVMLLRRGSDPDFVKVLDFGIASVPNADKKVTRPGEILGTAYYMPPKQWTAGAIDARTDVYALGAMVFEMLTGRPPFEAATPAALVAQHLMDPPPSPTSRVPSLRGGAIFDEIVGRCLAKRPEDRYQSMNDVLGGIGRVWEAIGRPSGRLTYAKTAAAPSKRAEVVPDATVYQSAPIDVVWDGTALCEEIRRPHLLRTRRLDELAHVLWPAGVPEDAADIRASAREVELRIDEVGDHIALLEARLDELWTRGREEEARLRLAVIDANLSMAASLDRLPEALLDEIGVRAGEERMAATDTEPDGARPEQPTERLRRADQRLALHHRRQQREEASLRGELN